MDWKTFAVCLFAITASYLILNMPVANAADITVSITGGSPPGTQTATIHGDYISEHITVNDATGNVKITVNGTSSATIDSVYIYKCQARDPSTCSLQVAPVSFGGDTEQAYNWNDVSDTAAHQTANILLVVHTIDSAGGRWLAFWSHGTKSGSAYSMVDSTLGSVNINAVDLGSVPTIKSFIDTKGMIPMNPSWVSNVVFTGATGIYDLEMGSPPSIGAQAYYSGNTKNNITGAYAFVMPYNSVFTLNGITMANSSNYICGDGACSSGLGESSGNCCLDCGTPAGYYCDPTNGLRPLSGILLSISSGSIKVSNCNVANTFALSFTMAGMPSGMILTSAHYALNGSGAIYTSSCTSSGGNIFSCSITTPVVAGCSGLNYVWSPNSMNFNIRFSNGSSTMTKTISAAMPDITVGSWTCGQLGCETGLGEKSSNCCYDCGCPAGYCDFATGQPSTSNCKSPVTNANLQVVSAFPPRFYTHDPAAGDNVNMEVHIKNAPQSVSVSSASCSVPDCLKSGMPCTAGCSVACTPKPSSNPNIYNMTCAMNFKITGYDPVQNYSIYPVISNVISYNNGTGSPISATLEVNGPVVSVGSHWKGDSVCDADENYATDCFDCACPAGQYCDSTSRSFFTGTDTCRQASGTVIAIDSIGSTEFSDASVTHAISVSAHIDGKPHGPAAGGYCSFSGSAGPHCDMDCTASETSAGYGISCAITVPAIDYRNSGFFDPLTRKITLSNNNLTITLSFNDGSRIMTIVKDHTMPDVVINVVPRCGDGVCSTDIGETTSTCCVDCGCSNANFCYTGSVNTGQCLDSRSIYLLFDGTNPSPVNCTIQQLKGACIFTNAIELDTHIFNQPSTANVVTSWFTANYGNSTNRTDANCVNTIGSNYSCSVILENLPPSEESTANISSLLGMTITYIENGTIRTQNLTANFTLGINREKSDYVKSCEEALAKADKKSKSASSVMMMVAAALAAILAIVMMYCYKCKTATPPDPKACAICKWGLCLTICISTILIPALMSMQQKAKDDANQKAAECGQTDPKKSSSKKSSEMGSSLITIALGILCVVCLLTEGFGLGKSAENPIAPGTTNAAAGSTQMAGPDEAAKILASGKDTATIQGTTIEGGTTRMFTAGSNGANVAWTDVVPGSTSAPDVGPGMALKAGKTVPIKTINPIYFSLNSGSGTLGPPATNAPASLSSNK